MNVALGQWRVKCRKFSKSWFLAVHISIPLIFLLRRFFGFGMWLVPLTVSSAVFGQIVGARITASRVKSGKRIC